MGNTFSTVQIKNSNSIKPNELLKNYMEKKGFIVTNEEEAQVSYSLIYSAQSDWVTLLSSEYEGGGGVKEDAEGIAKALKTHCIAMSVWDSDFIELELFGSTAAKRDSVIIGQHIAEDFPAPRGNPKLWQPLLENGATWQQLSEIFNSEHTFIEDSLPELAPLLGMDSDIIRKYQRYEDVQPDKPNILNVYFKKKNVKKSISLNAAFKQVFGEALEPLGFKLIKSKYPYFVRVVEGGEIIHVITIRNEWTGEHYYKAFNIMGGVATVYRREISLNLAPKDNSNWLKCNHKFYLTLNPFDDDKDSVVTKFTYDEKTMVDVVRDSLEVTRKFMLPQIGSATDINSCIEYFHKLGLPMNFYDDGNFKMTFDNEGFLYIKTSNYNELIKKNIKRHLSIYDYNVRIGTHGYTQEEYEERCKRAEEVEIREITRRNNVFSNPKSSVELEHRKTMNVKILRSCGFKI
ncbi:MAG: hypothetical protein FWH05_04835 [Oscillospiraceae bacterium]|nr:hypothetical protein [Oscillospiraceae bacterium]